MKASDYIAKYLAQKNVDVVFELSGGMITHILDSIYALGRTRLISMHHEQAAAFAADAVGRVTGIPGVAMATSGPGATNLLTGIGSCYFDSVPAVFITGQVNTHEMRAERQIRQQGFQEADIVAMAKPVTKEARLIRSADELPEALESAFRLALSGRPGPVLIDIPMNVQRDTVSATELAAPQLSRRSDLVPLAEEVLHNLKAAKRPLIVAGRGVRAAGMVSEFRGLA